MRLRISAESLSHCRVAAGVKETAFIHHNISYSYYRGKRYITKRDINSGPEWLTRQFRIITRKQLKQIRLREFQWQGHAPMHRV
jgi:hypothetical protein